MALVVKNLPENAGDVSSIPGSGRSPEEEMTTHSSILSWRIPRMEEHGRLQSMGSQRVGHDSELHFTVKEHPGLISFRMDWLDLHAVQWTLKSLLQHHSSKASILQCSAFFTVQLSHPYMTTGNSQMKFLTD